MFSHNACQSSANRLNNVGHNVHETRCSSTHMSNVAAQREHTVSGDDDIRTLVGNESGADTDSGENQAGGDWDTF